MDQDMEEQERLRELFGFGRAGEPVPQVDPSDMLPFFVFASSKLLPRTEMERSSQTPFQPSSSNQKLQSCGTPAITFSFTAWAVIGATPFLDLTDLVCEKLASNHFSAQDVWR